MTGGPRRYWALQQFTTANGKPWYALQLHTEAGIERQVVGYRFQMDDLCRQLGITPKELPPTTEEEFSSRAPGRRAAVSELIQPNLKSTDRRKVDK